MTNLKEMKVVELKEILRGYNLKVSGRKAELIERIEQFDEAIENYNTTKDVLVGYGAMYDYINRNITEEVIGATGGNFLRSRIDDLILNDNNVDFIEYLVDDVESLLDFYINGGNEHSKAEINEVRQFLNFLTNLSEHTLKRGAIDVWNDVEPSEASEAIESDESPAQESDVTEPAQDVTEPADEPTLVNKPITAFEGRTEVGKAIIEGIKAGKYAKATYDTITFLTIEDQICAYAGYDGITVAVEDGKVIEVYYTHRGAYSDVIVKGDELHRL